MQSYQSKKYESLQFDSTQVEKYDNNTTQQGTRRTKIPVNSFNNLSDPLENSNIHHSKGFIFIAKPEVLPNKPPSARIRFPPRIQKYEDNKNPLPETFQETFDSHFDFDYAPNYSCNSTEPIIIFKSSRLNFDRRNEVRQHLKDIDLARNYFFLTGQKSSGERQSGSDKYTGIVQFL